MRVIRRRRPERFTVLDNVVVEDSRLSYRALGVLAYLLSRPDGWETDSTRLARGRPEGRDAVRAAMNELDAAGYLTRTKHQDATTGRWSTVVEVADQPRTDFQSSGNQSSVNRAPGNQAPIQRTDTKNGTTAARGRVREAANLPPRVSALRDEFRLWESLKTVSFTNLRPTDVETVDDLVSTHGTKVLTDAVRRTPSPPRWVTAFLADWIDLPTEQATSPDEPRCDVCGHAQIRCRAIDARLNPEDRHEFQPPAAHAASERVAS